VFAPRPRARPDCGAAGPLGVAGEREVTTPAEAWELVCSAEVFDRWRDNPAFPPLLTLARIVNSLNFAGLAAADKASQASPSSMRQRINSFMYTGAVIYEAGKFLERASDQLGCFHAYRESLLPLFRRPEYKQLLSGQLHALRNRVVFHFDHNYVARRAAVGPDGCCVFGRGIGATTGESYWDLADRSALDEVIGGPPSEFEARYQDVVRRTTELVMGFLRHADEVITEALDNEEWVGRPAEHA